MRSTPGLLVFILAGVLAATILGCNRSPATPSSTSAINLQRIEIEVPTAFPPDRMFLPGDPSSPALVLAPGATVQLTARAYLADGSSRDVTQEAAWRVESDASVLSVRTGYVQAAQPGRVKIYATTGPGWAMKEVLVRPDGMFALRGHVRDGRSGATVWGARVSVVNGSPSGGTQGYSTASDGFYVLWSVPDVAEIIVYKAGFGFNTQRVLLGDDHGRLDFLLHEETPYLRLAGSYTLVVTADPNCEINGDPFPDYLRVRTYDADVEQTGNTLTVALSGAVFAKYSSAGFGGQLAPGQATFSILESYWMLPDDGDIIERLSPDTSLALSGYATISTTNLSGRLAGRFFFWGSEGSQSRGSSCTSENHQFRLIRRG